ncbi:hypothetical protein [Maritimibacter sp. HL-12]|uniref:hypothetical protein n=1 Tax=Maritimibacter sp. HL-12 TaxID=1162418 RepID=UPI000A0F0496|nr:hypothetical protein [Maritimibacter sp. HL-12]SMH30835.1 hypothetical protein SAMN05661107_0200 [Maritimibacter sp. HL-12]
MSSPGASAGTSRRLVALLPVLLLAGLALLLPQTGLAHDCSGPADCEQTAGYNAVISVVGAVSAVVAGVLGSSVAGGTVPGVIAGTTPPPATPGTRDESAEGTAGGFTELPPGSEGWVVTDTDGKPHVFATEEEANRYYERLLGEAEAEAEQERIRHLEGDYRSAAEQVEFLRSIIQGLKNAGRDPSEQIREMERYIRERDRLRGEVGREGGNTDYTPRERSAWSFGEHDDFIKQQKDSQNRLETIHRMSDAVDRMRDRNMVGENPELTRKILDRLDRMSDDMVRDGRREPTWEEIEEIKRIIERDIDATRTRQESDETNWVKEGAQDTAREIFTGVDSEGNTSYKAMVLRGLTAAATGGQSEIAMEVTEKMYGIHDDVMAGKSGTEAFGNAVKRVLVDETIGRVVEGGIKTGGKAGGELYERTIKGTNLDDALRTKVRNADEFLKRDVKDILRGSGDDVADGLGPRVPRVDAREADVSHGGRSFDQRKADFEAGRTRGAQKVGELDEALEYRRTNPDAPDADARVRDAVDRVQKDKHAMHELNKRGAEGPSETIADFNKELKTSYETAHDSARRRIADEYGVPIEDVKVVKPTNAPGDVAPADPRGFARKPDPAMKTDAADYQQRAPETGVEVRGDKASFDQDVTYRVRQDEVIDPRTGKVQEGFADVPKTDSQRIYNEEFYKARHGGDLPTRVNPETGKLEVDTDAVNKYAKDMDQACTDRLDAEAYGTGDRDLKTAVDPQHRGRDFEDVEAVGKTMEHKNYEWQNEAAKTRADANALDARADTLEAGGKMQEAAEVRAEANDLHAKAEGQIEEGYRQTTKQFKNQLEDRVAKLNEQHGRKVAEVPPRLEKAVDIMENPKLTPAEVELELAKMGYTPDKVVQQMSSNLESLQKFKPPAAVEPPAGFDLGNAAVEGLRGASKSGQTPGV